MFTHPQFDPVVVSLGPVSIRWYGLMYLLAFVMFVLLGRYRLRGYPGKTWTRRDLDDMVFLGVLGVVLGGRLGYVLFYKFSDYLTAPWRAFFVWEGGMSFHGGMLGVILAMIWFARTRNKPWLAVTDFIAPLVPPGLGAGRLGNFINGELWGRTTDVPWGMVFPNVDNQVRHASQLYQFVAEGLILFGVLWWFSRRQRPLGAISGLFLAGYGVLRFMVEYTREPDDHLGLLAMGLSMGQWLSLPMMGAGIGLLLWSSRRAN
jgi:phosphatidylglycerol---prolipoprotein diacylglyceryl transferase